MEVGYQVGQVVDRGSIDLQTIRRQIDLYHDELARGGHQVPEDMVLMREFFCAGSRDAALEKARAGLERKYEVYAQHGLQGSDAELTRTVTGGLDVLRDGTFILGSPYDCVEQLARYKELGFTTVCLRLFYPGMSEQEVLDHIELVGKDVLPELRSL